MLETAGVDKLTIRIPLGKIHINAPFVLCVDIAPVRTCKSALFDRIAGLAGIDLSGFTTAFHAGGHIGGIPP